MRWISGLIAIIISWLIGIINNNHGGKPKL